MIVSLQSNDPRRKTYVISDLGKEVLYADDKRMLNMIAITENMANQGWLLSGKFFFYKFQSIAPGKKTIRIDFRDFKSEIDFTDYCTLFEDRHIAGTKSSGTQYFFKVNDDNNEDIFSDKLSCAEKYKRLSYMWLFLAIMFIPLFLSMKTGGLTLIHCSHQMNGILPPDYGNITDIILGYHLYKFNINL